MIVAGVEGLEEEGSVTGVLSRHAEELGDVAVGMLEAAAGRSVVAAFLGWEMLERVCMKFYSRT